MISAARSTTELAQVDQVSLWHCWFALKQHEITLLFERREKQPGDTERCQQWVSFRGHLCSSDRPSFDFNSSCKWQHMHSSNPSMKPHNGTLSLNGKFWRLVIPKTATGHKSQIPTPSHITSTRSSIASQLLHYLKKNKKHLTELSPRLKVEFWLLLLQSLLPSRSNTLHQFEKHINLLKLQFLAI